MKRVISLLFLGIFLIGLVTAMAPQDLSVQPAYNCTAETNPLEIRILDLNKTLDQALLNLTYYANLSDYYKTLYESKEVNVTHAELIQIFNTLNNFEWNLNQTNQHIDEEFTKYKFDIGFYAFGGSILGFSIVEFIIWAYKKRKEGKNE
jgi:hypothetical protein